MTSVLSSSSSEAPILSSSSSSPPSSSPPSQFSSFRQSLAASLSSLSELKLSRSQKEEILTLLKLTTNTLERDLKKTDKTQKKKKAATMESGGRKESGGRSNTKENSSSSSNEGGASQTWAEKLSFVDALPSRSLSPPPVKISTPSPTFHPSPSLNLTITGTTIAPPISSIAAPLSPDYVTDTEYAEFETIFSNAEKTLQDMESTEENLLEIMKSEQKEEAPKLTAKTSWYSSSEEEDDDSTTASRVSLTSVVSFETPTSKSERLHAKLSSPERRRPSPMETKMKLDSKMAAASARRSEVRSAQKEKVRVWSDKVIRQREEEEEGREERRVKMVEKERRGRENAEKALEEVKARARKEDEKVSEVAFIQEMSMREFEDGLKVKLNDVEARISAARSKKEEARLNKMKESGEKKEKRMNVMSEKEVRRVQGQQERWDKLQKRIKEVESRKEARLASMESWKVRNEEKMKAAEERRVVMSEGVVKRSAEKEKRRFMAGARRSGDSLELEGVQVVEKEAVAKSNSEETDEWSLVTALTSEDRIPHNSDVNSSVDLKLVAMLEAENEILSREEKKKRRKKLSAVKKRLHGAGRGLSDARGDAGSSEVTLEDVMGRITAACVKLCPATTPTMPSTNHEQDLSSKVGKVSAEVERLVTGFEVTSAEHVQCLVGAYKGSLDVNHKLFFGSTCEKVVERLWEGVRIEEEKGEGKGRILEWLLMSEDGPSTVVEGAVRVISYETRILMGEKEEGRFNFNDSAAVKLLTAMLQMDEEGDEVVSGRKEDMMKYLVLTSLCDAVCALLRSAKCSPMKRREFVRDCLCLVQCLAKYYKREVGEGGVETFEELERVESEGVGVQIKDQLLEKVGGGLISLIASVLPASEDPNSTEINKEGVRLSADALRQLIQIARLDVRRFQGLCEGESSEGGWSGQGGYLEFSYVCNLILTATQLERESGDNTDVLVLCIVLIGYVCVGNYNNQQRLAWGGSTALLGKLSSLPFKFFCDARHKEVLFPTLVAAVNGCETNKKVIENDLNPEILGSYLREKRESVNAWLAKGDEGEGEGEGKRKDSLLEGDEQECIDLEERYKEAVECSLRLPMECWESASVFMEKKV